MPELHGHRGARGIAPENTLAGFAAALSLGVDAIEMDVGVTADGVVVVTHDLWLNPDLTRDRSGRWLSTRGPSIHSLTRAALNEYNVGRIKPGTPYAQEFFKQRSAELAPIPSLDQVIELVRRSGNPHVRLSIEAKISPDQPQATLSPESFAEVLITMLVEAGFERRCIIQCFDWRLLRHVQRLAPEIPTSYLTVRRPWMDTLRAGSLWTDGHDLAAHDGSVPRMVRAAGGAVWATFHKNMTEKLLDQARSEGIAAWVWTVNDPATMRAMIELGVNAIVTDYPDRLRQVMVEAGIQVPDPTPVGP